jgi:hypothetical protein
VLRSAFVGSGTTLRLEGQPSSCWFHGSRSEKLTRTSIDPVHLADGFAALPDRPGSRRYRVVARAGFSTQSASPRRWGWH